MSGLTFIMNLQLQNVKTIFLKKHGKEVIIKMNKKQYNNVIDWTLTHDQSAQTDLPQMTRNSR